VVSPRSDELVAEGRASRVFELKLPNFPKAERRNNNKIHVFSCLRQVLSPQSVGQMAPKELKC
jgi:hypothetical protein